MLQPNQRLLVGGNFELALLGPLIAAYLACLYGFHRYAGVAAWAGLVTISFADGTYCPSLGRPLQSSAQSIGC